MRCRIIHPVVPLYRLTARWPRDTPAPHRLTAAISVVSTFGSVHSSVNLPDKGQRSGLNGFGFLRRGPPPPDCL